MAVSAQFHPRSAPEARTTGTDLGAATRNAALDCTKGVLILCMVAYHAINYSRFRPTAFRYMAFLPPSFILITGFLVGNNYAAKYDLRTWRPYLRLALRGAKLLLLFVTLNLAHCIVLEHSFSEGFWEFGDRSGALFLSGNGRQGIFEVLLPIAYFLLLAPGFLWLRSRAPGSIALGALAMVATCFVLERTGHPADNLVLLSAGFAGMAIGLMELKQIDHIATKWVPVLLVYALYRACSYRVGEIYLVQMFGAGATLFMLYACALRLPLSSSAGRGLVYLGRYSLLGYLAQIFLLQGVIRLWGETPDSWTGVILAGSIVGVLVLFFVLGTDVLRRRARHVDILYRTVFA